MIHTSKPRSHTLQKGSSFSHILTVPNILTVSRIVVLPFFVYFLSQKNYAVALYAVAYMALSDFLDGKIARKCNSYSRLGEFLDPLADRLFMVVVPVSMCWYSLIPLPVLVLIMIRELGIISLALVLKPKGVIALPVIYVGKLATFTLMLSLVLLLGGNWHHPLSVLVHNWGMATLLCGTVLYFYSLGIYWWQALKL